MSISDADFFTFYQNFLAVIVAEGDGDMPFTSDLFGADVVEEIWFEKTMAALTRLGLSGLIYYRRDGFDIRIILKKMFLDKSEENWLNCYFIPTVLRKDLERIFDEHGV